jgi:hypothetical protein
MKGWALLIIMVLLAGGLSAGSLYIGRVDTIGGTTYDWQFNASIIRVLCNAPDF